MKNFIQLSELINELEKRKDIIRLGGIVIQTSEYLQLCIYADFNFDGILYGFGKINLGLSPGMEGWYGEVHHDLKYFPIVYVDRLELELSSSGGLKDKIKDIFIEILGPAYEVEEPKDEPENIIIRNKQGFEARCEDRIPYFDPEEEKRE